MAGAMTAVACTSQDGVAPSQHAGSDVHFSLHDAARKIQGLYRRRMARCQILQLVQNVYEKRFDEASGFFYYVNTKDGTSSWKAPALATSLISRDEIEASEKMQGLWRRRQARKRIIGLCQSCYDKLWDNDSQTYYYVNKMTGESSWTKPRLLAGTDTDIDTMEVKAQKEAKLQAKRDRDALVAKKRAARSVEIDEEKRQDDEKIQREIDSIWAPHLRQAARTNELNANCMKIDRVVPPVFDMTNLVTLRLVGNNLTFIPVPMMDMIQLRVVSFSNNKISILPERFCTLTNLVELNIAQNQLQSLPRTFGNLKNLEKFEIARNYLEELPDSFGNLEKISQLYLEHNHLKSLPESLEHLKCHYLNLNVNKLRALPNCLNNMPNLQSLIVNTNPLESLPEDIANMKQLTFLSCCTTKLKALPDSICGMVKLKSLWLDWCDLTGLPLKFANLTSLRTLKMEGNSHLVLPSIDVVLEGVDKVMKWCVDREMRAAYRRRQRIVEETLQLLHIIKDNGLYEESVFEPDVEIGGSEDSKCFAVIMDCFYTEMIPKVVEGKYWDGSETVFGTVEDFIDNRAEVNAALKEHQDSMGKCSYWGYVTYFRQCKCVHPETGLRRVCVPPKAGWQCERAATLIRMKLFSEEEVKKTLAKRREEQAVELAVNNAATSATDYINSVDGGEFIRKQATERANNEINSEKKKKWSAKNAKRLKAAEDKIRAKFKPKKEKLTKSRAQKMGKLMGEKARLEERIPKLSGWEREKAQEQLLDIEEDIADVPETELLQDICEKEDNMLLKLHEKFENKSFKPPVLFQKISSSLGGNSEQQELLKQFIVQCRDEFIIEKKKAAEEKVRKEHRTMTRIMASWSGLTKKYTFDMWRSYVKKRVYERLHFAELEAKRKLLEYENKVATFELAKWELGKWSEHMDVWSDRPFWQNDRGVIIRRKPVLEDYLPDGFNVHEVENHFNAGSNMPLDIPLSKKGQELIAMSERDQLSQRISARESARSNRSQRHSSRSDQYAPETKRSSSLSSLPPLKK